MTPQELKNSILQLAIQGKLVEQCAEEGTGEELLCRIREEKQRLMKEGKLKKEKPLPEITEDEKPFDIPESWEWCYIGDVFQHNTGKALNGTSGQGTMLSYITTSNLYWNRFELDKIKEMPFTDSEVEKCTITKGDLLVCEGGEFGRAAIWQYEEPMRIQNHIHRLRAYFDVCTEYFYFIFFLYKNAGLIAGKGIGIQGLSSNALHRLIIPLPPLAEQKRIVAKIEELLPYIDRYEQAWGKLEAFNKRFPVDMQKSLLQMAIQGKLVEQRPEEGTGEDLFRQIQEEKQHLIQEGKIKKQKPLPEISEDEHPFDIPESWKWVRLSDVCDISDGTHQTPSYVEKGMPFISAQNVKPFKFIPEKHRDVSYEDYQTYNRMVAPQKGDILMTRVGAGIGEAAIIDVDMEFSIYVSLTLIKCFMTGYDMRYLLYVIASPIGQKMAKKKTLGKGASQGNLNLIFIREFVLPLPPLAEQRRIVAKLEELLPLCERLK